MVSELKKKQLSILIESAVKLLFKKVETMFTPTSKSLKLSVSSHLHLDWMLTVYLIFKNLTCVKIVPVSG